MTYKEQTTDRPNRPREQDNRKLTDQKIENDQKPTDQKFK